MLSCNKADWSARCAASCPPCPPVQGRLRFALCWIDCHVALSRRQLGKPLVLSEFGKRRGQGEASSRSHYYSQVGELALAAGCSSSAAVCCRQLIREGSRWAGSQADK